MGDAPDPELAQRVLADHRPGVLVLNAGAVPGMGPVHTLTWEEFSRTWETDVRQAFEWIGAALRLPLRPGPTVIAMSSGAALAGSPVSGGYAAGKGAVRWVATYAAEESARAGLGLRLVSLLPRLTPATDFGAQAVAAYAARNGQDVPADPGPVVTPDQVARLVLELATGSATDGHQAYLVAPDGAKL